MADVPVTVPIPWLMLSVVAPLTAQLSVVDWPVVTLAGAATKLVIFGRLPTVTLTEAVVDP